MHQAKAFKYGVMSFIFVIAVAGGSLLTVRAQATKKSEPVVKKPVKSGRDVFSKYLAPAPVATAKKPGVVVVVPPSIETRIERYRGQKVAAMNAHLPAPKPTTALLLTEIQVVGISRTPRGYAAIVEATPIKLSYVIYPGEKLYDGQLVAVEDARLVFRHETIWSDGRHDQTVETKSLRQQSVVEAMTTAKAAPVKASEVEKNQADTPPKSNAPSREEIEIAVRQGRVMIGMEMQDVSRAWGNSHANDTMIEQDGLATQRWVYSRGEVYFRNGVVRTVLLKS